MAIFRKVHVTFWKDNFIETLTPEQRYFYLYLITNGNTTQCGIYEISIRQMCFDTGYNKETVLDLLKSFTELGKIKFSDATNEIALKNWAKYNDSTSPKVKSCVKKELKNVKDRTLIEYVYSINTVSIHDKYSIHTHTQEEEEKEQEEEWKTTTTDFENSKRKAFTELFKRIANWDSNVIFSEVDRKSVV